MTTTAKTIGNEAAALYRKWQEHDWGNCAANTTLFAVFAIASPQGGFADGNLNHPYGMWLQDIAYDHGVHVSHPDGPIDHQPRSAQADAINANELTRHNGRKVPMTDAARTALLDYYAGTIKLLSTIDDFLVKANPRDLRRFRKHIARHSRSCAAVLSSI